MSIEDSSRRFYGESERFGRELFKIPHIIWRSFFPRSIVGKYQDDPIMRSICSAAKDRRFSELSEVEIVELVGKVTTPAPRNIGTLFCLVHNYFEAYDNATPSEFLGLVVDRLKHLETYRPTNIDFAIEELQNASVGFWDSPPMSGPHWLPISHPNWPQPRVWSLQLPRSAYAGRRKWRIFPNPLGPTCLKWPI